MTVPESADYLWYYHFFYSDKVHVVRRGEACDLDVILSERMMTEAD